MCARMLVRTHTRARAYVYRGRGRGERAAYGDEEAMGEERRRGGEGGCRRRAKGGGRNRMTGAGGTGRSIRLRWGAGRKWFSNLEQLLEVRAARGKDDLVRLELLAVARERNVGKVLLISQRLELACDVRLKVIPPQAKLLLAIRHSLHTLDSPSTTPVITHVGANLEYHMPVGKT